MEEILKWPEIGIILHRGISIFGRDAIEYYTYHNGDRFQVRQMARLDDDTMPSDIEPHYFIVEMLKRKVFPNLYERKNIEPFGSVLVRKEG